MSEPVAIEGLSFEAALAELEQIVAKLESGQAPLEDSIRMYERGAALKAAGVIEAYWVVAPDGSAPTAPGPSRFRPTDERGLRGSLVETARGYLGVPYLFGGTTDRGFDCSGLVYYVFKEQNIAVPRVPKDMFVAMTRVPDEDLAPGDVVFFNTFAKLSHVGIYIGDRQFIHAPHRGKTVAIESLDTGYYAKRYVGARRVETARAGASSVQLDYSDAVAGL